MDIKVLHQTPHYLVCVKPQGVESEHEFPRLLSEQTGHPTFWPVHRLDKETGGVMVYAKSKPAAADLSRQVQEGTMQKIYLAVVAGIPQPAQGRWDELLFRDRQKNKSYLVKRERKGVKKASLSYETLGQVVWNDQTVSLVKVQLHTGRTHQIRAQFSGHQHPLVGDRRYGGMPNETLALWAWNLSFSDEQGTHTFRQEPPKTSVWGEFKHHNFE